MLTETRKSCAECGNGCPGYYTVDGAEKECENCNIINNLRAIIDAVDDSITAAVSVDGVSVDDAPMYLDNSAACGWVNGVEEGQLMVCDELEPARLLLIKYKRNITNGLLY